MKIRKQVIICILLIVAAVESFGTPFTLTYSKKNVSCNGGTDGSITVYVDGGIPDYIYIWYKSGVPIFTEVSSDTTSTLANIGTGSTYFVVVQDGDGHQGAILNISITEPNPLLLNPSVVTDVTGCFGNLNGQISASATGGTPPCLFTLKRSGIFYASNGTGLFAVLPSGSYTVEVNDASSCGPVISGILTINEPSPVVLGSPATTNVTCNGGADGSISITASGGTPGYTYSLYKSAVFQSSNATGTFTGLTAGTYTVQATDANGCGPAVSGNIQITQPTAISLGAPVVINTTCNGGSNGSITITASGGTPGYTYSLYKSAVFQSSNTTGIFPGLTAGTYTVQVTDSRGCGPVISGNITVGQPPPVTLGAPAITHVTGCYGNSNGSISISAAGGIPGYTYTLKKSGITQATNSTGTFTSLTAGTYTVEATDQNSCGPAVSGPIVVNQPSQVTLGAPTVTNVTGCFGNSNGSITISAAGGTPPYTYTLKKSGIVQSTNATGLFPGLSAGSFTVEARDLNNCGPAVSGTITLTQPPDITISETTTTPAACFGGPSGTITITASGGTPPLQYSINGGGSYQPGNTFTGLLAGNYPVVVRDANICTKSGGTVTVTQPPQIVITSQTHTNLTCFGDNSGTITIAASGGTPPLQYSINGGSTFQAGNTFTGLPAGNYPVVVRDANLCLKNGNTETITQPAAISILTEISTNVTGCFGNTNGTITITASGGTSPLQYSINGGSTYQASGSFTGLGASSYPVVVKDANNCTKTGSTLIITQPAALSIDSENYTNVTGCFGNTNGTITITASGGTPPLQYSVNGGSSFQASGNFTGLGVGSYPVVVRDANNCTKTGSTIMITQPAAIVITSETATNLTCFGVNTGTITIIATGGVAPLQYSINGGTSWQAAGVFTGLAAGNYPVAVRDAALCVKPGSTLTITQPAQLVITSQTFTNLNCYGDNSGTISLAASGGTPPLQYSLNGGSTYQSGGNFTGLAAGNYSIMVRDANFCTRSGGTITISQPAQLQIVSETQVNVTGCYGNANGSITITASGGTAPLGYSVNGGTSFQASGSFTGLTAGSYPIVVRDANNCIRTGSTLILTQPPALNITSATATNISCNGLADGTISITASGGTPSYTYSINGGTTFVNNGGNFTGLAAGSYPVAVRDNNGCIRTGSTLSITEPQPLSITSENYTNILCNGTATGTITIVAGGGTSPYQYSVNGGSSWLSNGGLFTSLVANAYAVAVRDFRGCTVAGSNLTLTEPPALTMTVDTTKATCNNTTADGSLVMNVSGGVPGYLYSINGGLSYQASSSFTGLLSGQYNVVAKDNNNCLLPRTLIIESKITVIANAGPDISICPGTEIMLSASGGDTYLWTSSGYIANPTSPNPLVSPVIATDYQLTAYRSLCSDIDSITVSLHPVYGISAGNDSTVQGGSSVTLTATGGFSAYLWQPATYLNTTTGQSVISTPTRDIQYTVTGTTAEGCLETDSVNLSIAQKIKIPSGFTPNNDGVNDTWEITNAFFYPDMTVDVFTRWGARVFHAKGYNSSNFWDGTHNGKDLPMGTYYFVVQLNDGFGTKPITGPVTIIR